MARTKQPPPEFLTAPFVVAVDSNEQAEYHFKSQTQRHAASGRVLPLIVETRKQAMWTMFPMDIRVARGKHWDVHRVGLADYSIVALEQHIQIERKSISDLFGTIGGRRGRFEAEIKRLSETTKASYVVIEGSWADISIYNSDLIQPSPLDDLLGDSTSDGSDYDSDDLSFTMDARPRRGCTTPAIVLGTISSWSLRYRNCHWITAGSRGMAEAITYKLLSDFYQKCVEGFYPDIKIEAKGTKNEQVS